MLGSIWIGFSSRMRRFLNFSMKRNENKMSFRISTLFFHRTYNTKVQQLLCSCSDTPRETLTREKRLFVTSRVMFLKLQNAIFRKNRTNIVHAVKTSVAISIIFLIARYK